MLIYSLALKVTHLLIPDIPLSPLPCHRSTDLQNKVATQCLQMHGGWGYMWEYPIARAFVDARVQPIYGGANEIMKELIARHIITD